MGRGIQSAQKAQEAARTETYLQGLQTQVRGGQYLVLGLADRTSASPRLSVRERPAGSCSAGGQLDRLVQNNAIDLVAPGRRADRPGFGQRHRRPQPQP